MNDITRDFNLEPEELLAAYEAGLLDDADRARFEAALLENPDLLEELYAMAPFAVALQTEPQRYGATVENALRHHTPSPLETLSRALRSLMKPRMLVPVVVAVLAFVWIMKPGDDSGDLRRMAVLDPLAYVQVDVRAGASDWDALYRQAMDDYLDGRYRAAATGLTGALAIDGIGTMAQRDQARLYLGVSHLLADEPAAAMPQLTMAAQSLLMPVADSARWYQAQAYLVLGQADAARDLLSNIAQTSPVRGEAATHLLARIDQLIND